MSLSHHSSGLQKMNNGMDFVAKSTPVAMIAPELKNCDYDTGITKTCAVMGCEDSKSLSDEEYFRFPEDTRHRQIWTDLTGRSNWTPTDYSYICIQHFSVDSFECNTHNEVVLMATAVPSLRLPKHVLEVEYIDEESLDNDYFDEETEYLDETNASDRPQLNGSRNPTAHKTDNVELLKLFTEVQTMQRNAVDLKHKLKLNMKLYNRQNSFLKRLQQNIIMKKGLLSQKRKRKQRILLSLQDKILEDKNGLVLAMPAKYTDDLKNFALSIYKYSPQAYIYARNSLRTMLPATDVLESWLESGYTPNSVLSTNNTVKVVAEQTETEMICKVSLH